MSTGTKQGEDDVSPVKGLVPPVTLDLDVTLRTRGVSGRTEVQSSHLRIWVPTVQINLTKRKEINVKNFVYLNLVIESHVVTSVILFNPNISKSL